MSKEFKEKFEKVCAIKDKTLCLVEEQINENLDNVDAKELGEVVDIAKDMAEIMKLVTEAEYYYEVTNAMKKSSQEENEYYINKYIPQSNMSSDLNNFRTRMYYTNPVSEMYNRDDDEGKSGLTRKIYMDMKRNGADRANLVEEMRQWALDLTSDVMEMLNNASTDEKSVIKQHLTSLASKIN